MFKIPPYSTIPLTPEITFWSIFWKYLLKYRFSFLLIGLTVMIGEILESMTAYVVKLIVDLISHGGASFNSTTGYMVMYWCLVIIGPILFRIAGLIAIGSFPIVRRDIRVDFFTYLHRHSHRYFANHFGWALTNKVTTAGRAMYDLLGTIFWDMLPYITSILVSLGLLFISHGVIALITVILILLFVFSFYPFLRQARKYTITTSDARSFSTGKIADVITNIWNLQSYARSWFEERYLVDVFGDETQKHQKSLFYMQMIRIAQHVFIGGFIIIITVSALYFWSIGRLTVGDVTLIFMVVTTILQDVRNVLQRLLEFNEQKSDLQDAIRTIIVPHEISDTDGAGKLTSKEWKIEFKDVSFAYDSRGNVFDHLSFTIKSGERIGLVGVSGSGKSSIVSLLGRFYDIQDGAIEIDGQDIRTVTQESLREAIGIVPQDPVLFHRSLAENIAYGKEDATEEEIISASELAHAHEFVAQLPEQYESKVWERGVKLSGGQRQRIAIARAILKNAPILILDEATSALDSENEELIQDALQKVMEWKTVIAVAHRLSTLKNMDRIIVLEKGKIIEDGSHAELIARDGIYSGLFNKQVKGFIG